MRSSIAVRTQTYEAVIPEPTHQVWLDDSFIGMTMTHWVAPQDTFAYIRFSRADAYLASGAVTPVSAAVSENALVFGSAIDAIAFNKLVDEWHLERGATSSITKMALCKAYQQIVGMGETVVPLILRRMESEGNQPDMWFWALQSITRTDPVPANARGNMPEMAKAWLSWASGKYAW